jgi:hypothetical protein
MHTKLPLPLHGFITVPPSPMRVQPLAIASHSQDDILAANVALHDMLASILIDSGRHQSAIDSCNGHWVFHSPLLEGHGKRYGMYKG